MTSPFGSKVLLEAKLPDQKFFRNLHQRDFDSTAPASTWSNFVGFLEDLKTPKGHFEIN